jgi:ABC-type multidrug transport system fused ATPase/permease subunit
MTMHFTGGEILASSQVFAAALSSILCASMTILAIVVFLAPNFVIHHVFGCLEEGNATTELETMLSRLVGGMLMALSLSSTLLLGSFWTTSREPLHEYDVLAQACSVDKCRTSLSFQAIVGLFFVIVGLWDDRFKDDESECGAAQYKGLWACGASFIVVACLGLMASFWPVSVHEEHDTLSNRRETTQSANGDLAEPLLPSHEEDAEAQIPNEEASQTSESDSEISTGITSRIRGTRRLIKLAQPQVFYLYLGCAVLLVRLPFSLSIPHFISTTLGALARGDFASARMEILLLFILGTIDAALDFWCVFLFGYAKERIVRGVRIDTFASILRQEVSFFDRHTSGELSSRLSSDCGEMAGGTSIYVCLCLFNICSFGHAHLCYCTSLPLPVQT